MKLAILLSALLATGFTSLTTAPSIEYKVAFSTYLGGNNFDAIRDVCVDHHGNVIVVGGTGSTDFPVTPGAYQSMLKTSTGPATASKLGNEDVCVAKFSPGGQLLWSTYVGGPGYDRAYAVEVDSQDRIFVAGRAGPGFPTTPGCFQSNFISTTLPPAGGNYGIYEYGDQCGFAFCMTPHGQMVWSTYVFYSQLCRDMAVDDAGDVYFMLGWNGNGPKPPDFASGYRKSPILPGGTWTNGSTPGDTYVLKLKGDGTQILWGSWLCGSGPDAPAGMVRVDAARNVYFLCFTKSTDMPFNPQDGGIHTHAADGGKNDLYLAKLSADGNGLLYGTCLGGNADDYMDTHQLAVDPQGNAYVACSGKSTDMPVTPGVLRTTPIGGTDITLFKVGSNGKLLLCTYLGGTGNDGTEGLAVDAAGNVFVVGVTYSNDFPTAGKPFQAAYGAETTSYPVGVKFHFQGNWQRLLHRRGSGLQEPRLLHLLRLRQLLAKGQRQYRDQRLRGVCLLRPDGGRHLRGRGFVVQPGLVPCQHLPVHVQGRALHQCVSDPRL